MPLCLASGSTTLNREVRHGSARESRFAEEPAVPVDVRRLRHPYAFRNVRTRKPRERVCPMARISVEWPILPYATEIIPFLAVFLETLQAHLARRLVQLAFDEDGGCSHRTHRLCNDSSPAVRDLLALRLQRRQRASIGSLIARRGTGYARTSAYGANSSSNARRVR